MISLYIYVNPSIKPIIFPPFFIVAPPQIFPVRAVDWIKKNNLSGNILPFFDWGEFLIMTCYPTCKVGMDGRYETVYEEDYSKQYFNFIMAREGWKEFLGKYPHDIILVLSKAKICSLLHKEQLWEMVYSDETSSVFIKKDVLKSKKISIQLKN
jgi:hypothetical protein